MRLPRAGTIGLALAAIAITGCVGAGDPDGNGDRTTATPSPTTTTVTELADGSSWPPARRGHRLVADGTARLVLFGGRSVEGSARTYLDDTWIYDTRSGLWTEVPGPAPTLRSQHAMSPTGTPGTILLFGGYAGDRFTYPGTWLFDGSTWSRVDPEVSPPSRAGSALVWDAGSEHLVLFGGAERPRVAELPTDETWWFDPAVGTWQERTPAVAPRPKSEGHPTLFELAMAYDAQSDRSILLIGGDETWAYDADADAWERRADPGLEADFMVAAAYDAARDRVVTHGGGPTSLSNETWLYDYDTDTWSMVATPESPGPIGDHAMAYDPITELTYLFGGAVDLLPLDGIGDVSSDLWVFDGATWERLGPDGPGRG